MRLETPKRTQTEFRKVILEFPHIVLSHGQVMKEVAGARLMLQRNRCEFAPLVPLRRCDVQLHATPLSFRAKRLARVRVGSTEETHLGGEGDRDLRQRQFRKVLKRAGLPPTLRLYDLRHSCATLLLAAGEHPKVVSEGLGHASTAMTLDVYSHVVPSMQRAASDKLEAILSGGG